MLLEILQTFLLVCSIHFYPIKFRYQFLMDFFLNKQEYG